MKTNTELIKMALSLMHGSSNPGDDLFFQLNDYSHRVIPGQSDIRFFVQSMKPYTKIACAQQ